MPITSTPRVHDSSDDVAGTVCLSLVDGDKVMMLNGLELDKCNHIEGLGHWEKASKSHMHAMTHAKSIGANVALVMGEAKSLHVHHLTVQSYYTCLYLWTFTFYYPVPLRADLHGGSNRPQTREQST